METRTSPHLAIQVEYISKQSHTAPFNSDGSGVVVIVAEIVRFVVNTVLMVVSRRILI